MLGVFNNNIITWRSTCGSPVVIIDNAAVEYTMVVLRCSVRNTYIMSIKKKRL